MYTDDKPRSKAAAEILSYKSITASGYGNFSVGLLSDCGYHFLGIFKS